MVELYRIAAQSKHARKKNPALQAVYDRFQDAPPGEGVANFPGEVSLGVMAERHDLTVCIWEWRHSEDPEQRHLTQGQNMNQQMNADDGLPNVRLGAGTNMVEMVMHLYDVLLWGSQGVMADPTVLDRFPHARALAQGIQVGQVISPEPLPAFLHELTRCE